MVDPTDKDTKHTKDRSTGTEGYLEYTKENEKGKVNQLDGGGGGTRKTKTITKPGRACNTFFFVLFMLFTCS